MQEVPLLQIEIIDLSDLVAEDVTFKNARGCGLFFGICSGGNCGCKYYSGNCGAK